MNQETNKEKEESGIKTTKIAPARPKREKRQKPLDPAYRSPSSLTVSLINDLAAKFPPEYIADKIEELLTATHLTKGGNLISDNRAREAGLKLLLAYLVGLPVQRQEVVQVNITSLKELQGRVAESPALRNAVAKILEGSKDVQIDALPKNERDG